MLQEMPQRLGKYSQKNHRWGCEQMKLLNPTGRGIRSDSAGDGRHGAPRGHRVHDGVDLLCEPGQEVISPIDGTIPRYSNPYSDDQKYRGLIISNKQISITMFYLLPSLPVGATVKAGDVVGHAQDISEKHGGDPHIHLRVNNIDPMELLEKHDNNGDEMFVSHV